MTEGPGGSILPQEFTYNSVPCPRLDATIDDFTLDDEGSASVAISGTVTDQASDLVADPAHQLQNLEIRLEEQVLTTIPLSNVAQPELPWRPYQFRASFFTRVSFTPDGLGALRLNLVTPQNVAGCASTATFYVNTIVPGQTEITTQADSDPGTFLPTMLRIYASGSLPAETRIFALGQYWNIDKKNFGDGEYWYAVESHENPVVFLPSAYVDAPYAQFAKLEDTFAAAVVYLAAAVAPVAKIPVETGLLVFNDDITEPEDKNLLKTVKDYEKDKFQLGADTVYIYRPKNGKTLKDLGHTDDTLDTEIKWRFVGTHDTVSVFRSRKSFETDITHREGVVEAARSAFFSFSGNLQFNTDFWEKPDLVKKDKTAFDAVADIWNNQRKYQMACLHACIYSFMRGASQAIGDDAFNKITERSPFNNESRLRQRAQVPNLTKGKVDNDNPNNANWIPGDWGYISNADTEQNLRRQWGNGWMLYVGENVIYVGGPRNGDGNFNVDLKCKAFDDNCFLRGAYFFGLIRGVRIRSFQGWIDEVKKYSTNAKPIIDSKRDRLRQPQGIGSAVTTDLSLTPGKYAGGKLTIGDQQFSIVDNTEATIFTSDAISLPCIVEKNKQLEKLGAFSYVSFASDKGTDLLGGLTFAMINNEFERNARMFFNKKYYDIQSNSHSTITVSAPLEITFKIVDKNGENSQEGKITKLTGVN